MKPIQPDKWYIINTFDRCKKNLPRYYLKAYDRRVQVIRAIYKQIKDPITYDYLKGSEIIEMGIIPLDMVYIRRFPKPPTTKYDYNIRLMTRQEKKSFRTKFRRQNRNKRGELYGKY